VRETIEALAARKAREVALLRSLEVEGEGVGQGGGLSHRGFAGPGNDLEVHVAAEAFLLSQEAHHAQEELHGGVRIPDHPGGEEEPLHESPAQIGHEGPGEFLRGEARPRRVLVETQGAIGAVVHADVGEQGAKKGHAASAGQDHGIDPASETAAAASAAKGVLGARAGEVEARVFGKDLEAFLEVRANDDAEEFALAREAHTRRLRPCSGSSTPGRRKTGPEEGLRPRDRPFRDAPRRDARWWPLRRARRSWCG